MRNMNQSIGIVICVILLTVGCVFGQDWPQWRGPNRDGKVNGFTAPATWPTNLTQRWKVTVGLGDATPALVEGKLYVFARQGAEEVTLCLNATDGKELWKDKYEVHAEVTGPASSHSGPRSSPAVADGKVVTLGVGGILSCLDIADGKVLWRKDEFPNVVPQFFTATSPLIVDGMVIAHLGGKGNGAVMAFDLATGNVKWKWTGEGPEYASPALMTVDGSKQIVTLTEKSIVGIGVVDGKLLWQLPFAPAGMASSNNATPVIDRQTVIYSGNGRSTKAVSIEKQGDGFIAKELWSNNQLRTHFNTPVLKDGLVFGLSDRGNLFCLNAQTGEAAWTEPTNRRTFGAILDAGAFLMVLPEGAELTIYNPDGKQHVEIAKYKVAQTPTYAHPIISGKRIFVKDQDSLTMWTLE